MRYDPIYGSLCFKGLTLTLLTWRIWWAPNNARTWQMGFNSAFKGLTFLSLAVCTQTGPHGIYGGQIGIRFLPFQRDSTSVQCPFICVSPTLNKFLNFWWSFTSTPRVWCGQEHLYLCLLPGYVAGPSTVYSIQSKGSQILRVICTWSGLLGLSIH